MWNEADIAGVVALIVAEVDPRKVVLFGSAARGEIQQGSDVDLMVVIADDAGDPPRVRRQLYDLLARERVRLPVELVVAAESDVERKRNWFAHLYWNVDREGRVLHAA